MEMIEVTGEKSNSCGISEGYVINSIGTTVPVTRTCTLYMYMYMYEYE